MFRSGDGEVDSDGDCDGATESASKAKQKAVTDLEENKSKKEHINVIFIGHVGKWLNPPASNRLL